ncbi:MAG: hypothetical protein M3O46_13455 [Myxococcota bacterium]|nr:hypothetical protein [Myxococcota bacterium]
MAAVVHHGGAGTTAASARAGVPQVVVPMFGDQFYWASRVRALGIGSSALGALATETLATALQGVLSLWSPRAVGGSRRSSGRMARWLPLGGS